MRFRRPPVALPVVLAAALAVFALASAARADILIKPFRMERDHFSREWDDAPMPHSIFFTMQGHAIHGSNHVKAIGTPASHGCVRLRPENAAILFDLVKHEGMNHTKVALTGETPEPAAPVAQRNQMRRAGTVASADDDVTGYVSPSPRRLRSPPRGWRYARPYYRHYYYYDRGAPGTAGRPRRLM
jgi:hypothetical protein